MTSANAGTPPHRMGAGLAHTPQSASHAPEATLQRASLQQFEQAPDWATQMYEHRSGTRTCYRISADTAWLYQRDGMVRLCEKVHYIQHRTYAVKAEVLNPDTKEVEGWEGVLTAWLKGDTDVLDFKGEQIPQRLRDLLDPAHGVHAATTVPQQPVEAPYRVQKGCDRVSAHRDHEWPADQPEWWCPGLKAHRNTMIGRNG